MEEASGPPAEVWPCFLDSINVMVSMSTQWRVSYSGPTGLDYAALPVVMRLAGIPSKDRADLFDDLRIMEDIALEVMRQSK